MKHVVALSFGKDSTALALRLREVKPRSYIYLCTPTGNELPELEEHIKRMEERLESKVIRLKPMGRGDGLLKLINRMQALPNWRQRWCTRVLKIEPTLAWLEANAPCIHYVGLRADEEDREGIYGRVEGITHRFPMKEWGWDEQQVWSYLTEQGIQIPRRTDCAWCYGQRLIEWKELWERYPELYEQAVSVEEEMGFTFRSPGRDTWPAGLRELREEFIKGRKIRGEKQRIELYQSNDGTEHGPCRVCRL